MYFVFYFERERGSKREQERARERARARERKRKRESARARERERDRYHVMACVSRARRKWSPFHFLSCFFLEFFFSPFPRDGMCVRGPTRLVNCELRYVRIAGISSGRHVQNALFFFLKKCEKCELRELKNTIFYKFSLVWQKCEQNLERAFHHIQHQLRALGRVDDRRHCCRLQVRRAVWFSSVV